MRGKAARYRRDNEKRLAAATTYRDANRESINARRREFNRDNPDLVRAANRSNYIKHREARIAYACEYQRLNPHVVAASRIRRASAGRGDVSGRDLSRLLARYRNCCAYCRTQLGKRGRIEPNALQWDHVMPLSRGGRHSIGNLVPACRLCNSSKSDKFVTEWRRDLFRLPAFTEVVE